MKKYTNKELFEMDAVDVYKLVLRGDIKTFPRGFWMQPEAKQNVVKCVGFLIEEVLKLSDEEVKKHLSTKLFKKYKLGGMLNICFNDSPYEVINTTYPDKFKPWEFKNVSINFWQDKKNIINATKWLVEEKLKLSDKELKKQLSREIFERNNLNGMLVNCFNGSPYEAINTAYPNKFKPWEFKSVGMGYWKDKENSIKATKWLIEEKLKLSDEELKEELSSSLFNDNGLYGMLNNCFNGSPYDAINTAYPGKFKREDFKNYR